MLNGFALAFGDRVDYPKAIELFENVEEKDLNNQLGYAYYLGLIYSHIKNNSLDKAIEYFDKLPTNNSIFDLFEGPWYFISVEFCEEYKKIFDLLELEFEHDLPRRKKARCLYALYLYNPSETYGIYRYEEIFPNSKIFLMKRITNMLPQPLSICIAIFKNIQKQILYFY